MLDFAIRFTLYIWNSKDLKFFASFEKARMFSKYSMQWLEHTQISLIIYTFSILTIFEKIQPNKLLFCKVNLKWTSFLNLFFIVIKKNDQSRLILMLQKVFCWYNLGLVTHRSIIPGCKLICIHHLQEIYNHSNLFRCSIFLISPNT